MRKLWRRHSEQSLDKNTFSEQTVEVVTKYIYDIWIQSDSQLQGLSYSRQTRGPSHSRQSPLKGSKGFRFCCAPFPTLALEAQHP